MFYRRMRPKYLENKIINEKTQSSLFILDRVIWLLFCKLLEGNEMHVLRLMTRECYKECNVVL